MKLAFLHIPKTGGVSVESAIERAADGLSVCSLYQPGEFLGKTYMDVPGFGFYKGHFDVDFLSGFPNDFVKAVVVRRPVDQVLSLCNHIASRKAHRLHAEAQGKSLAQLLDIGKGTYNQLTKYLLGRDKYQEICLNDAASRPDRVEAAIAAVRENLKAFDVIGMTSHLGAFVKELGEKTGADLRPPHKENINKSTIYSRDELTDEDMEALNKATWVDRPVFKMIWDEILKDKYAASVVSA